MTNTFINFINTPLGLQLKDYGIQDLHESPHKMKSTWQNTNILCT